MSSTYVAANQEVTVQLLFFGAVAEAIGKKEEKVTLRAGSFLGDIHAGLLSRFPQLEGKTLKCAVDQQFCSWRHVLSDGEEVAIFTPVSGG